VLLFGVWEAVTAAAASDVMMWPMAASKLLEEALL
jgi:hypothetical protein